MRSKAIIYLAFLSAAMCATPALTATYNYVGSSDAISGNYLTASVELDCVAPCVAGSHSIKSFALSTYSNSNVLLTAVSNADVIFPSPAFPAFEFNSYLTLDNNGDVTNWSLYRYGQTAAGDTIATVTMGFALPGLAEAGAPLVSGEFASLNGAFLLRWSTPPGSADPPLGVWSQPVTPFAAASEVPLPAALPLFATVVAAGGLLAWRRKRKTTKLAG